MANICPEQYLSWREAQPLLGGISRTTAWRGVRDGWLPSPVQISPGRQAWRVSDIIAWQSQLQPRRELAAPNPVNRLERPRGKARRFYLPFKADLRRSSTF